MSTLNENTVGSSLFPQGERQPQEGATRKLSALLFSLTATLRDSALHSTTALQALPHVIKRAEWPEYPTPRYIATLSLFIVSLASFSVAPLLTPLHLGTGMVFDLPTFSPDFEEELRQPQKAEDLKGQSRAHLIDLFGEAELVRNEPPLEIWQYRTRSCVLDVYLKPDSTNSSHVTYAEVRARHSSTESQLDANGISLCLSMLADKPNTP